MRRLSLWAALRTSSVGSPKKSLSSVLSTRSGVPERLILYHTSLCTALSADMAVSVASLERWASGFFEPPEPFPPIYAIRPKFA